MVEQRSSKSYAWVRFLLSLIIPSDNLSDFQSSIIIFQPKLQFQVNSSFYFLLKILYTLNIFFYKKKSFFIWNSFYLYETFVNHVLFYYYKSLHFNFKYTQNLKILSNFNQINLIKVIPFFKLPTFRIPIVLTSLNTFKFKINTLTQYTLLLNALNYTLSWYRKFRILFMLNKPHLKNLSYSYLTRLIFRFLNYNKYFIKKNYPQIHHFFLTIDQQQNTSSLFFSNHLRILSKNYNEFLTFFIQSLRFKKNQIFIKTNLTRLFNFKQSVTLKKNHIFIKKHFNNFKLPLKLPTLKFYNNMYPSTFFYIFFSYSLIYKFFLFKSSSQKNLFKFFTNFNTTNIWYTRNFSPFNNLIPVIQFSTIIKKKFTQIVSNDKFHVSLSCWYNATIIRFMENCLGNKILLQINPNIILYLNLYEITRCSIWAQKLKYFKKTVGAGLFLLEAVKLIYISLKLKDPHFLITWMCQTLHKISFWKLKTFFYFLRYFFRYFLVPIFSEIGVKGIKFKIKGKISVAGNSRTRTVVHTIGKTSPSTFTNKIIQVDELIRTFTGVIGFRIWLVF